MMVFSLVAIKTTGGVIMTGKVNLLLIPDT
jgi:hypothetical protein